MNLFKQFREIVLELKGVLIQLIWQKLVDKFIAKMCENLMGHTQQNLIDPKLKKNIRMQNVLNLRVVLVNIEILK